MSVAQCAINLEHKKYTRRKIMTMEFIKQEKGKALQKITLKNRLEGGYCLSLKMDGQMIQIAYDGSSTVRMWSSNGHEFFNKHIAAEIILNNRWAFQVEAEYTGLSAGLLGDRGKASKITTYRTEFEKGILSEGMVGEKFWVFDILTFDGNDVRSDPFSARYGMLMHLSESETMRLIIQTSGCTIEQALDNMPETLKAGYEGLILTHCTHTIGTSSRNNLRIKLKENPTDYATIIGTIAGEGERTRTIGSLLLRDDAGFEFSGGTGLNSAEWVLNPELLKGIRVKFGYESIKNGVYQQPRTLGAVLEDKSLVRLNEVV